MGPDMYIYNTTSTIKLLEQMEGVGYENCKTFFKFKIRWVIKKFHNKYCYLKKLRIMVR
jgi:hypothetical protein